MKMALVCYVRYSSFYETNDTKHNEWEYTTLSYEDYLHYNPDVLVIHYIENYE